MKLLDYDKATGKLLHFNSIKVRLKQGWQQIDNNTPIFQFHKGTIETLKCYLFLVYVCKFQFHKGTIETNKFITTPYYIYGFQFHKGTIETLTLRPLDL